MQVSTTADVELGKTQRVFDTALFGEGGHCFSSRATAYQPGRDGGLGHINIAARMRAEWAQVAIQLAVSQEAWVEVWKEELRGVYGTLAETHLEKTTCSFLLFAECEGASELQRRSMRALGGLPAPTIELMATPGRRGAAGERAGGGAPRQPGRRSGRLPMFEALVHGEREDWGVEDVREQRLFFNPWHQAGTMLTGRSTIELEREAVRWAAGGLVTYGDLMDSDGVRDEATFELAFPGLSVEVLRAAMDEMLPAWVSAWHDETPSRHGRTELVKVAPVPTLDVEPEAFPLVGAKVKGLYAVIISQQWYMPSPFRDGNEGDRVWATKGRPRAGKLADIGKIVSEIQHPAVPRWMSDRVRMVATRSEFGGTKFAAQGGRRRCNKCGADLTCEHKYARCEVALHVWKVMFRWWERMTGEKLDPADEWVTLWAARWADDKTHPREEPFRVMHACVVAAIHHDSSVLGEGKGVTAIANVVVSKARAYVQQVCQLRWAGSGRAFREEWGGLAEVGRAQVRILWDGGGDPDGGILPATEVYTDGSAKEGKAGYGFTVVHDGVEIDYGSGPVEVGARTNNVGEMLGIQRAVEWAVREGVSVTIRYDSKYAANHARGRCRVRRNAAEVAALRGAVRAARGVVSLGWKHVKGHSGDKWNDRADELADLGAQASVAQEGTGGKAGARPPPARRRRGRNGWIPGDGLREGAPSHGGRVRWVTGSPTEAERIGLSRTRHGCLNTVATRRKSLSRTELRILAARCLRRVRRDVRDGASSLLG